MSDELPRAEWKRASYFAEIAEALGVATTTIVAAMRTEGERILVVYSPNVNDVPQPDDVEYLAAYVAPDADGILVLMGDPVPTETFRAVMRELLDSYREDDEDD
jgi:hypothetical protein